MSLLVDMVSFLFVVKKNRKMGMCRVPQYIFQFQNGILETLKWVILV